MKNLDLVHAINHEISKVTRDIESNISLFRTLHQLLIDLSFGHEVSEIILQRVLSKDTQYNFKNKKEKKSESSIKPKKQIIKTSPPKNKKLAPPKQPPPQKVEIDLDSLSRSELLQMAHKVGCTEEETKSKRASSLKNMIRTKNALAARRAAHLRK